MNTKKENDCIAKYIYDEYKDDTSMQYAIGKILTIKQQLRKNTKQSCRSQSVWWIPRHLRVGWGHSLLCGGLELEAEHAHRPGLRHHERGQGGDHERDVDRCGLLRRHLLRHLWEARCGRRLLEYQFYMF